ncbi:unnamed protein product [Calypogeia fissa]
MLWPREVKSIWPYARSPIENCSGLGDPAIWRTTDTVGPILASLAHRRSRRLTPLRGWLLEFEPSTEVDVAGRRFCSPATAVRNRHTRGRFAVGAGVGQSRDRVGSLLLPDPPGSWRDLRTGSRPQTAETRGQRAGPRPAEWDRTGAGSRDGRASQEHARAGSEGQGRSSWQGGLDGSGLGRPGGQGRIKHDGAEGSAGRVGQWAHKWGQSGRAGYTRHGRKNLEPGTEGPAGPSSRQQSVGRRQAGSSRDQSNAGQGRGAQGSNGQRKAGPGTKSGESERSGTRREETLSLVGRTKATARTEHTSGSIAKQKHVHR